MYLLARILAFLILEPFFFFRITGEKNLVVSGAAIVIANHKSNWDPIALGYSIKHRPVCYMAKGELYKNSLVKWLLLKLHTIPIARGKGDTAAIKAALAALGAGKLLGIFPEGTRSKDGAINTFQPGFALLALKANVPIIPVYIKGDYKLFHTVHLYAGTPVDIRSVVGDKNDSASLKEAAEYMHSIIVKMAQQYG